MQIVTTMIAKNAALKDCTTQSIIGATLSTAQIGLEPIPELGLVYYVPYKNNVQLIIGYKGMIQLALRSPQVKEIYSEVVREGDKFRVTKGTDRAIYHEPEFNTEKAGDIIGAYGVVKLTNGGTFFEYIDIDKINDIKSRSAAGNSKSSPWHTDFEAMVKKTAIRQVFKYVPLNSQAEIGVAIDEAVIDTDKIDLGDIRKEYNDPGDEIIDLDDEPDTSRENAKFSNFLFEKLYKDYKAGKINIEDETDIAGLELFAAEYAEGKTDPSEAQMWANFLRAAKKNTKS